MVPRGRGSGRVEVLDIGTSRELPTVLLIDDDMISREVIATILTLNGYTLHTAEDGEASLTLLDGAICIPQVILADVQMAGLSGTALVQELRARSKAVIFAISGSDPPADLKASVDGFLLKPFGPEALQKLLDGRTQKPIQTHLTPDIPVISAETLSQFRQIMPEATVREMYKAVLADLEKRVSALETAIAAHDAGEVRRIGHTIKGGCGMAGVMQASRLGAVLEVEGDELISSGSIHLELKGALESLKRKLEAEFPA
jgi:CheY-like chemotaxis protein/HPt (histidine-containing phosphotransfer) domain-containing protein